jgi:hypothetical protein
MVIDPTLRSPVDHIDDLRIDFLLHPLLHVFKLPRLLLQPSNINSGKIVWRSLLSKETARQGGQYPTSGSKTSDILALILYPIILFLEVGNKVRSGCLLLGQRLHIMFEFLQLEFGIRYSLLLALDHAFELFQLVVEAGKCGALFL